MKRVEAGQLERLASLERRVHRAHDAELMDACRRLRQALEQVLPEQCPHQYLTANGVHSWRGEYRTYEMMLPPICQRIEAGVPTDDDQRILDGLPTDALTVLSMTAAAYLEMTMRMHMMF